MYEQEVPGEGVRSRRILRIFPGFAVIFFMTLALPTFAARRGPIVIGLGAGYSSLIDSDLGLYEVYHPKLIFFSEQLKLKHNINGYIQYFPWRGFGFQLEYDHQKADYYSDLKWYGSATPDGKIIEIDYIEEPYRVNWSLTSITASILYALTLSQHAKFRPFISAGVGYYFSSGEKERFYERTRLGPKTRGNLAKLGLGVKYQITPRLGINLKGTGTTIWRRDYGYTRGIMYVGSDQFDANIYLATGRVIRREELLINSFSYLGVSLSLELTI